jgi:excisionase family DNA binding protein
MVGKMTSYQIAMDAIKAFACMHPRPSQVNRIQACEMLNISRPTLNAWIKDGKLKTNKCGLISVTEIDRLLSV